MIKTLQKKFVITAMTAVGILLLVLFSVINVVNFSSVRRQDNRVLDMLSEKEFSVLWQIPNEFGKYSNSGFLQPPMDENMRRSSIYFIAYADKEGKIIYTDTRRTAGITKESAAEKAEIAVNSGNLTGKVGNYRYKAVKTESNIGTAYVFLDITQGRNDVLRLLFLSAAVMILCFALTLLLTAVLSKKAIKPIAENMEKQKNFVTDAGHEIKTPLAVIMANTEALELYSGETKWTKNIKEQTSRLSILTEELLSLSRLEETKTDNMLETVSVSEIVSDTVSMFYENAALKNVKISGRISPGITMKADREHVTRLISILTDNAVKYSREGSEITVSLFEKDRKTVFSISNVCDALPDCDSEKLFDRFYRGDSARTQKNGGYGIGLSAARTITRLYKGKISAEYKDGNTITFTVTI